MWCILCDTVSKNWRNYNSKYWYGYTSTSLLWFLMFNLWFFHHVFNIVSLNQHFNKHDNYNLWTMLTGELFLGEIFTLCDILDSATENLCKVSPSRTLIQLICNFHQNSTKWLKELRFKLGKYISGKLAPVHFHKNTFTIMNRKQLLMSQEPFSDFSQLSHLAINDCYC